MQNILVLCTGNSCRSVMAEALINHLGTGKYRAYSAGSHPTGQVHPQSIATLQRHNIPVGNPTSQSWNEFADYDFDLVITVCDCATAETCPAYLKAVPKLHWSTPDPAHATGTEAEITAEFDTAFQMLKNRIETELLK